MNDVDNELELDKTPFYIPVNETRERKKTANGIVEDANVIQKRYYSPIDAEVYFGDYYVEDIVDINYTINQQAQPLFGYNSFTADEIAVGSRIIQGTFSINFTSPRYLFTLLEKAKEGSTLPNETNSYQLTAHERNHLFPKGFRDENLKGLTEGKKTECLWPQTFDIDIVYGPRNEGSQFFPVHVVLEGVRIITCSQGASAHANVPVVETYSFVAKDYKVLA